MAFERSPVKRPVKRAVVALAASLVLGGAGLYVVAGADLFRAETYRVREWDAFVVAVCLLALLTQWLMPAVRVRLLCLGQKVPVSYGSALLVHLVSVFGAAVTPSNSGGGPAAAVALGRLGLTLGASLGVVVQIFILDLIFFAWAVPVGLFYLISSGAVDLPLGLELFALTLAAVNLAGAVLLARHPRTLTALMLWAARWPLLRRLGPRLRAAARDYRRSSRRYVSTPVSRRVLLNAVTAVQWLAAFVLLWGLLKLYGVDPGLWVTLALMNVLTLVSQFVPTPGGAGFVETAVGLSVGPYAAGGGDVAAALLLWRALAFHVIFLIGPLAAGLLFRRSRTAPKGAPAAGGARRP